MKINFIVIFLFIAFHLTGQKTEQTSQELDYNGKPELIQSTTILKSEAQTKAFLEATITNLTDYSIRNLSTHTSLKGKHYTFIQTYKGVDVYQGLIKVNTDLKGSITSIFSGYHDLNLLNDEITPKLIQASQKTSPTSTISESKLIWFRNNKGIYEKAASIKSITENGLFMEEIYNVDYVKVFQTELSAHFSPQDTLINAYIYKPDPLTVANTEYGGSFVDNNDQTNSDLDAQRDSVQIKASFENGEFILENQFIKIVAISPPLLAPVTQTHPDFHFNRSELGFEEVNALYHITKQQEYIQSLGFNNIVNYAIDVDCHGFNGADNSAFNPGTNPPSIIFGQVGVDDAEDADVIIHEYTHAIMNSAAPGTSFGSERKAMEEAFGDYMAVSYSSIYDTYHDDYVFNWDGHNEYWQGRLAVSSDIYPADLNNNLYLDAPMWSSALIRIEKNIGRDKATTLAIEAGFSYTANMTMAQAAQVFLQTDTLLYNGAHYGELCWIFKDKGFVQSCTVDRPNSLVGINNQVEQGNHLKVYNSEEFAIGNEPLLIITDHPADLKVYDLSGKLIYNKTSAINSINVNPSSLSKGTYIFKITSEDYTQSFKIIKL